MKNENLSGTRLKSDISMLDIVGNIIVWVLLSVVTFGLAMFVFCIFTTRWS